MTVALPITERQLQDAIIECAHLFGWLAHHSRPARRSDGTWSTAISGDTGLPDLILVRAPRVILAELKVGRGRVTPKQQEWAHALSECPGVSYRLWTPLEWMNGEIEGELR